MRHEDPDGPPVHLQEETIENYVAAYQFPVEELARYVDDSTLRRDRREQRMPRKLAAGRAEVEAQRRALTPPMETQLCCAYCRKSVGDDGRQIGEGDGRSKHDDGAPVIDPNGGALLLRFPEEAEAGTNLRALQFVSILPVTATEETTVTHGLASLVERGLLTVVDETGETFFLTSAGSKVLGQLRRSLKVAVAAGDIGDKQTDGPR